MTQTAANSILSSSHLVDYLRDSKDDIVRIFSERAPKVIFGAKGHGELTLIDHLPQFLEILAQHLEKRTLTSVENIREKKVSRKHGAQRAELASYTVEQILAEYRLLRKILFDVLEKDMTIGRADRDLILDVIQIGAKNAASQFLHVRATDVPLLRWLPSHRAARYTWSVVIAAGATAVQWFLYPLVEPAPYIVFYPAVLLAAIMADGMVVTIIGAIVSQFLFVHPGQGFVMEWPGDYLRVLLFLMNATLIAIVTKSLKTARAKARAAAKEQETAKHEAEDAIRNLQAERNLREQFVATLTHDLRGPLTAVRASAQLLVRHPEKVDSRERLYQRIITGTDRADEMIRDLLDVSRIQAGQGLPLKIEHCELQSVVSDVLEEQRLLHGDRFVVRGDSGLSGYWGCDELRRILDNLISNAVKYGAQDGTVTISFERENGSVAIRVHNETAKTKEALTRAEIKSLFDPYHRAKGAEASGKKGWGLGLTLVKGFTESHGGTVEAESSKESGTTFTVKIPVDARDVLR